jgi:hypothetical protein
MSSMKPIALAALDPRGPAEIVLTRTPYLRPASKARTLVSLSRAALALLMPPPYPEKIMTALSQGHYFWVVYLQMTEDNTPSKVSIPYPEDT